MALDLFELTAMATGRGEELVRDWRALQARIERGPRERRDPRAPPAPPPPAAPTAAAAAAAGQALGTPPAISSAPMFLSRQLPRHSSRRQHAREEPRRSILPVPYERTVSYGPGTRNGPGAILEASHYVELYDDELDEEVYRIGVHTLPAWLPDDMEPAACVAELEAAVARAPVAASVSS